MNNSASHLFESVTFLVLFSRLRGRLLRQLLLLVELLQMLLLLLLFEWRRELQQLVKKISSFVAASRRRVLNLRHRLMMHRRPDGRRPGGRRRATVLTDDVLKCSRNYEPAATGHLPCRGQDDNTKHDSYCLLCHPARRCMVMSTAAAAAADKYAFVAAGRSVPRGR